MEAEDAWPPDLLLEVWCCLRTPMDEEEEDGDSGDDNDEEDEDNDKEECLLRTIEELEGEEGREEVEL